MNDFKQLFLVLNTGTFFENYYDIFTILDISEESLPNGPGSVKAWLQTISGLEKWEKSMNLGDAYLKTSAKSKLARAYFTLGLLCLHNFNYDLANEFFKKARKEEVEKCNHDFPMAL